MSTIPKISQIDFSDMYIGDTYCDIKGLTGTPVGRVSAPPELNEQIGDLRGRCKEHIKENGDPEFSLILDGIVFRVTEMIDVTGHSVFFLRRSSAVIRPMSSLGLPPHIMKSVLEKDLRGLILVAGEMGAGKTSTAASIVVQRLMLHGGIAVAVEDPPETKLDGLHGKGRCIQIPASRKRGGYQEHMLRAMRTGADLIFLGEIRDEDSAYQALKACINGHTIISTTHAGDIPQAIERLHTLCSAKTNGGNAYSILAEGLSVVIWQTLEKVNKAGGQQGVRLLAKSLSLMGPEASGVRSKIRNGQVGQIKQDIEDQSRLAAWNMQQKLGGGRQ